jgi:hypothetical protein
MPLKCVHACLIAIAILLVPSLSLATPVKHYHPPDSLSLNLRSISQNQSGAKMKATIKSLVGTQSNLSIYFDSSKDLKVTPAFSRLPALQEGQVKEFKVKVTRIGPAEKYGSWVRFRVEYQRDIAALEQRVRSYPNAYIRKRVLDNMRGLPKKARSWSKSLYEARTMLIR